ncbi:MAG: FkbM family methyltransferase [Alphaproteobacteria bacterium]|nr:FkbM family methyltransferase [Alphaproteobacteria bacterium]
MPSGDQDQVLSRDVEIGSGFNRLRLCRTGITLYNRNDIYVGRALQAYGESGQIKLDLLSQLVRPGNVVVDVGAHIGVHAIALAKVVGPTGAVIAIEPQRLLVQSLSANAALNSLTNVFTLHAAAGEKVDQIIVPGLNYDVENNFGAVELGHYTEGEAVPLMPLDNLPAQSCQVLTIDVEGMELAVIRGGTRFIERFRPVMYVTNYRKEKSAALIGYIMGLGYRLYWNIAPLFNPQNFYGNPENIFGNTVTVGMVCLPPGDTTAVEGRQITSPADVWHGGASVSVDAARMD